MTVSPADAAAAARARAEAEARAKAEAERAKAEAEAKARAEQQTAARELKAAQAAAQRDARAADRAKLQAQQADARAKQHEVEASNLRTTLEKLPPSSPEELSRLQADVGKAGKLADASKVSAAEKAEVAEAARQKAVRSAAKTLSVRQANAKHLEGGVKVQGEELDLAALPADVFSAATLAPKDQATLLGTVPPVTGEEKARSDVAAVGQATERSPEEGAQVLLEKMEGTADPAKRDALAHGAAPHVAAMGSKLAHDPSVSKDEVREVSTDLARAGSVQGAGTTEQLGGAFSAGLRDTVEEKNEELAEGVQSSVATDRAPREFAVGVRDTLEERGNANDVLDSVNAAFGDAGPTGQEGLTGALNRLRDDGGGSVAAGLATNASNKITQEALPAVGAWAKETFGVVAYHDDIDKLQAGDRIGLSTGSNVSVGAEVSAAGRVDVSRAQSGKYTVTLDAAAGVGLYGAAGAGLKGATSAGAAVGGMIEGKAGARLELTLDNAEDAKRAVDTAMNVALQSATASVPGATGVATATEALAGMQPQSAEWVAQHTTAVEARAGVSLSAFGFAGGKAFDGFAGAMASAGTETRGVVRLEMERGKPTNLVLRAEGLANGSASLGMGLGPPPATAAEEDKTVSGFIDLGGGTANGNVLVRFEQKIPIAAQATLVDAVQAATDPARLVKNGSRLLDFSRSTTKLTANGEVEGAAYLLGGPSAADGIRGELSMEGPPEQMFKADVIGNLLRGRFTDATSALGDQVKLTGAFRTFKRSGLNSDVAVTAFTLSAGAHLEAQRTDAQDPRWQFAGKAADGGRALRSFLVEQQERVKRDALQTGFRINGFFRA